MHVRVKHRSERSSVCEFCSHAFTQKTDLNLHLRTHTGKKPFQGHLCGKTVCAQANPNKHNHTHSAARPSSARSPSPKTGIAEARGGSAATWRVGPTFASSWVYTSEGPKRCESSSALPATVTSSRSRQVHLRRPEEICDQVENYSPRQHKPWNLVTEEQTKMVMVTLQTPVELQLDSAKVIVKSLPRIAWPHSSRVRDSAVVETELCEPRRPSLITATIPADCDTEPLQPTTAHMAPDPNKPHGSGLQGKAMVVVLFRECFSGDLRIFVQKICSKIPYLNLI